MPAAQPETLKAIEEARANAERLFHAYAGASSKATGKQARDLFGRLAAWEMHHFEEMDRALISLGDSGAWIDYQPTDFVRMDPKLSDRKDLWDRSGVQYFNEQEALQSALENERASYTMFLGLAAKAREAKERDFWTGLAAEEELHGKVLKDQLDALRTSGKWTWLETVEKGAPKASYQTAQMAVKMIAPLSTTDLPGARVPGDAGTRGDIETELLPPGWESAPPGHTQKHSDKKWLPPPISDPTTPMPGSGKPATAPSPGGASSGGGWVAMGADPAKPQEPSKAPTSAGWLPMGAETPKPPEPPKAEEKPRKSWKPPTTVRHVGKPIAEPLPAPGKPGGSTDTVIMDRPLAQIGGRWVYEASVKTAAQLCAPHTPPTEDCMALISGPARRAFLDILNRRGSQGWELLQLGFHKDTVVLFWKRRE